jgi:1,2-diacylglycerol 3-alpha-glucosyltransferase
MKIAIFSDVFYPINSGVASYLVTTVQELSERGHKVYLFIPRFGKDSTHKKLFNQNVKVFRSLGVNAMIYPQFKITGVFSLTDLINFKKIDPDIVFFQTTLTMGLKGIMLAKMLDKPLIGVFHMRLAQKENLEGLGKIGEKLNLEKAAWGYLKYFYKDCDAVLCPSLDIKRDLERHNLNKNIILFNNFIDSKRLDNQPTKIKIKKNSFLYLGRLAKEKNIICLLESFKILLKTIPETYLYLIGDGPSRKEIEFFIKKNKLQNNVFLLGMINREIILKTDLLNNFLAMVTMSHTEVQPITFIEAMFKKLPIIGPNFEGVRELIKENGILVGKNSSEEMARAMLSLIKNPSLQKNYLMLLF